MGKRGLRDMPRYATLSLWSRGRDHWIRSDQFAGAKGGHNRRARVGACSTGRRAERVAVPKAGAGIHDAINLTIKSHEDMTKRQSRWQAPG